MRRVAPPPLLCLYCTVRARRKPEHSCGLSAKKQPSHGRLLRLSKNKVFRTASRSEPRFRSKIPLSARAFQAHLPAACIKTHAHGPGHPLLTLRVNSPCVAGFYENCNLLQFSILCALRREGFFEKLNSRPLDGCFGKLSDSCGPPICGTHTRGGRCAGPCRPPWRTAR